MEFGNLFGFGIWSLGFNRDKGMTKQESIRHIQQQIKEIEDMEGLNKDHPRFKGWLEKSIAIIKSIENLAPKYLKDFVNLPFHAMRLNLGCNPPSDPHDISRYREDIHIAKTILESIVDQLKLRKD